MQLMQLMQQYHPAGAKPAKSLWLAESPAKRWTEVLFLSYSPFWMVWALGIVVPFKLYEVTCQEWLQSAPAQHAFLQHAYETICMQISCMLIVLMATMLAAACRTCRVHGNRLGCIPAMCHIAMGI